MSNTPNPPASHPVPNPPENADLAAPGVMPIIVVDLNRWTDAWVAFFDALGIDGLGAMHVNSEIEASADSLKVIHCQRVPGVRPIMVGDDECAEWGWPVRIEVAR